MPQVVILLGGGRHASDVLGAIEAINRRSQTFEVRGLLDDGDPERGRFEERGVRHVGRIDEAPSFIASDVRFVMAVGYPQTRRRLWERVSAWGGKFVRVIDSAGASAFGVGIGNGTVVFSGATISPLVKIGMHVFLGHQSTIGHDSRIGDFATVMPSAVVSGDVSVGEAALVGANATILQGLSVGRDAVVGAGAVVTRDVPPGATVAGVPAKPLRRPQELWRTPRNRGRRGGC